MVSTFLKAFLYSSSSQYNLHFSISDWFEMMSLWCVFFINISLNFPYAYTQSWLLLLRREVSKIAHWFSESLYQTFFFKKGDRLAGIESTTLPKGNISQSATLPLSKASKKTKKQKTNCGFKMQNTNQSHRLCYKIFHYPDTQTYQISNAFSTLSTGVTWWGGWVKPAAEVILKGILKKNEKEKKNLRNVRSLCIPECHS